MCGIGGYLCTGEYDPRLNTALPLLGTFMTERGKQSWGWTNGTDIYKSLGTVRSSFDAKLLGYKSALIHTRHSTTGAITAENSHPFSIKGIIGVHNGMIHNHWKIGKDYPDRNVQVDSEHIFHHIADGISLSELEGYGAVVFWRDGSLFMGRFNSGELTLARTEFGWIYASTKEAVNDALHMSGLASTVKFYVNLKEGVLYQIKGDQIVRSSIKLNVSKGTSTATWQGGYSGGGCTKYVQKGFWAQNKWYVDAADWEKQHPGVALPANAPKPAALPASTTTTAQAAQEAWYEGYDDSTDADDAYYERRWQEGINALSKQAAPDVATEIAPCDYCGLYRDVVIFGKTLICEDCYDESEDDIIEAQEDQLRAAQDFLDDSASEYLSADDYELCDARTYDPQEEEVCCDQCNMIMRGDTPLYFRKDVPDETLCRFCFQDEFVIEEENNTPSVTQLQ